MNYYVIPKAEILAEIRKPHIPFTNIPNPVGAAIFKYKDGHIKWVPLFYIQEGIRGLLRPLLRIGSFYMAKKRSKQMHKYFQKRSWHE